jgi:flagellar biogenesis protein FliO
MVALAHHATHGSTGAQSVSASSLLIQMMLALIVIVVLIKLASRFVQGRRPRLPGGGARSQGVSVVGRQSLGKGVQVAMVAAGTQTYLLGVTQRQVTLLGQVDTIDPKEVQVSTVLAESTVLADSSVLDRTGTDDATGSGLQLLSGGDKAASNGDGQPVWRSAIEQMRVRTMRRA